MDAAVVPFLHILKCSEQSTWSKSQKIQVSHYEDLSKKVFCLIYLLALWLSSTTTGKILNKVFDLLLKCAVSLFEFKLQERGNVILQHGAFLLNCFTLIQTNSWKAVGNFFESIKMQIFVLINIHNRIKFALNLIFLLFCVRNKPINQAKYLHLQENLPYTPNHTHSYFLLTTN